MMMSTNKKKRRESHNSRKTFYIVAPFLLLALFLVALNLLSWQLQRQAGGNAPLAATLAPVQMIPATSTPIQAAIAATATPTSFTAPPSPMPLALPEDATITLLGPPVDTFIPHNQPVAFYWRWRYAPDPEIRLALYVEAENGDEQFLAALEEPNVGLVYNITALLETAVLDATTVTWFVQAEHIPTSTVLRQSEVRSINLYQNPSS